MLKKIGNVYVDPSRVLAAEPDCVAGSWALHLQGGGMLLTEASEAGMAADLTEAGLLPGITPPIDLNEKEFDELRHMYAMGCSWIARDRDGKAYAYRDRPELRGACWDDGDGPMAQLRAGYRFLTDGGGPMKILALLARHP